MLIIVKDGCSILKIARVRYMYIHVVIMHIYIAQFSYFFLCLLLKRYVDVVIEVLKQIAPV